MCTPELLALDADRDRQFLGKVVEDELLLFGAPPVAHPLAQTRVFGVVLLQLCVVPVIQERVRKGACQEWLARESLACDGSSEVVGVCEP